MKPSKELLQWVKCYSRFNEYDHNPRAKIAAFWLGYIPKCECGNIISVFSSKFKPGFKGKVHTTPFGGFNTFCCRACMTASPETIKKRKHTNMERFGAETWAESVSNTTKGSSWTDEKKRAWIESTTNNNMIKYGVAWTNQLQEVKVKKEQAILDKTNGQYTNMWQDVDHIRNCNLEKYGVTSWKKTEAGRAASSGENNPLANSIAIEKMRYTKASKKHDADFAHICLFGSKEDFKSHIDSVMTTNEFFHRQELANHLQLSYSYLNSLFRRFGMRNDYLSLGASKSYEEESLFQFVKSIYNGEIIRGSRSLLGNGQEIDIFIPELMIGIEYDNLYTHSEHSGGKNRKYHITKTDLAEAAGIHLIHVFSNEWMSVPKRVIIESKLRHLLGLSARKIPARKTVVESVPVAIASSFFDSNHIAGNVIGAEDTIALVFDGSIMMALSYGKSRANREQYEIYRIATKLDHTVVGGIGKLLSHIPATIKPDLITFADRRFSYHESAYEQFFSKKELVGPNWFGHKNGELLSRWNFTKSKFMKMVGEFDASKTVFENMVDHNYDRIWDCGNWKYSCLI